MERESLAQVNLFFKKFGINRKDWWDCRKLFFFLAKFGDLLVIKEGFY